MKIKGSSVAAIGIGAFLTGVAAGVAACRKDCLKAAGQFFGGVVSGAGVVAVASMAVVATAQASAPTDESEAVFWRRMRRNSYYDEMASRPRVHRYRINPSRNNWDDLTTAEQMFVREFYGL